MLKKILKGKNVANWNSLAVINKLRVSIHKKKALEIGDHESSDLSSSDDSSSSSDLEDHEIL